MTTFAEAVTPFIGWREALLIIAALAILFLQYTVLRLIKRFTEQADAASHGQAPTSDLGNVSQNTRNEVERFELSIKRLSVSTRMAIDQMCKNKGSYICCQQESPNNRICQNF